MTLTLPSLAQAEAWCKAIAPTLEVQHIRPAGLPYLDRYFVAGWSPRTRRAGPALFLHHFLAGDPDNEVHNHPWGWSCSLILSGGYREHRCHGHSTATEVKDYRPGDINILEAKDRHRIDLLERDCWTLFLAGDVQQAWNFSAHC